MVREAVAVALEGEDFGVVDEPVDHCCCGRVVAEDLAPCAEGLVAGEDQAVLPMEVVNAAWAGPGLTGALFRGFVRGRGEPSGMPRARKYPPELIERGVRLVLESERPVAHVADDLGIAHETLRKAVRQAEADSGKRGDLLSGEEREEIKKLRREVFELRRANEILKSASVFFAKELDPDRTK